MLINEEIEIPLDFFLVAKENAVSFASETRVMDGCASLVGDLLHRGQSGLPGREQVSQDHPYFGDPMHLHCDLGDDAKATFGAEHHLAYARAGRGVR